MSYTTYDRILESNKVSYDVMGIVSDLSNYVEDYAAESDIGFTMANLFKGVLKKAIFVLTGVIDKLHVWGTSMARALAKYYRMWNETRALKNAALYSGIENLDFKIKELRSDVAIVHNPEKVVLLNELLEKRTKLYTEYESIRKSIYVNADHKSNYDKGRSICLNAKNSVHVTCMTFIQKITSDISSNEMLDCIKSYSNGSWRSESQSSLVNLSNISNAIDENRMDPAFDNKVEVSLTYIKDSYDSLTESIRVAGILEALVKDLRAKMSISLQDTMVATSEQSLSVRAKKIPEYIMTTVNTVQHLIEFYKSFVSSEAKLLFNLTLGV